MSSSAEHREGQVYLNAFLQPLAPLLADRTVTEILVNGPGEVFVETIGGAMRRIDAGGVDDILVQRLASQIARVNGQAVNRENPLLSATLPTGERVQIVGPPATRRHWAMAIRRAVLVELQIDDFAGADGFSGVELCREHSLSETDSALVQLLERRSLQAFFQLAVRARKTMLISGGTSSGKTSLLNALLRLTSSDERLISVEDTAELRIDARNAVGLIAVKGETGEARVTIDDLLNASLRMRPDRIILGEIRGSEAATFLRAINTGHPGSISTIHADSPQGAFEQIALLALQSGLPLTRSETIAYSKSIIDVVIQVARVAGERRITHIMFDPMTRLEHVPR